jgi:hypothetical protein
MSYEKRTEEHLYHAFALGVGGFLERDRKKQPIAIAAPNALSVSGGSGLSQQKGYEFVYRDPKRQGRDFSITVDEVTTEVAATELEDRWLTMGRAELRNVNINDVVKADLVRGVLTSMHMKRKTLRAKKQEAPISAKGSAFENLTVKGVPVRLAMDDTIESNPTHEKLRKFTTGRQKAAETFRSRNFLQKSGSKDDYICDMERFINESQIRCSIYSEIALERDTDGVKQHCYSLDIADFGRLYIGEIVVADGSKRLNMLRFDLGCVNCGGGTGGSVDVNGATMP